MTEKIGLDALFDTALRGEDALTYFLKNALGEAVEEPTSSLINHMADIYIAGDKSQFEERIRYYMENEGLSESDAFVKATVYFAEGLGKDFLGGLASGSVVGGTSVLVGSTAKSYSPAVNSPDPGAWNIDLLPPKAQKDAIAYQSRFQHLRNTEKLLAQKEGILQSQLKAEPPNPDLINQTRQDIKKLTELVGIQKEKLRQIESLPTIQKLTNIEKTDIQIGEDNYGIFNGVTQNGLENRTGRNIMYSGGVFEAYSAKNDPDGVKRDNHADVYYNSMRNRKKSFVVSKIARRKKYFGA